MTRNKRLIRNSLGQTLLEVMVVIAVSIVVVAALVFATIASLRNAQFSNNEARATSLAQEGLEKVRSIRDRNAAGSVVYTNGIVTTSKFSDLYSYSFECAVALNNCYFTFNASGNLIGGNSLSIENLGSGFTRQIQIEDGSVSNSEKKVTSVVTWSDYSGPHSSRLSTLLRKL